MTATGPFGGAAAVVRWCEHPATERRHAEHIEEASADVRAVHDTPARPATTSKLSPDQAKAPSNRSLARVLISCQTGYDHDPSASSARLPGSRTGSGRRMRLLKIENSDVLAPMPSASVPIATNVKARGSCAARESPYARPAEAVDGANRPDVADIVDGERHVAERTPARVRGCAGRQTVTFDAS